VVEVLQEICESKRLAIMVRTMALEIERLNEDNQQLRAAIRMYREVVRLEKSSTRVGRHRL
jgi:hypothetical protein